MSEDSKPEAGKRTPPAGSFATLTNFLEQFKKSPVPSHIDRSVFPSSMSGANQALQGTLKFFDLISSTNVPEPEFHELVAADKDENAALWNGLVKAKYAFVFDGLDIERTTSSIVIDRFRAQNISGDTIRKAITFFLHASKTAGIKISPHVKAPRPVATGTRGGKTKKTDHSTKATNLQHSNDDNGSGRGGKNGDGHTGQTRYEMLIEILDANMSKEEQEAVWILIRYLKTQDAQANK